MHPSLRGLVAVLWVTALPLAAQEARPFTDGPQRTGLWFSIGVGTSRAGIDCPWCAGMNDQDYGMLDLRFGTTLSPKWRLGVEASGGRKSGSFRADPTIDESVGDLNVSAYFYPSAAGNFWLQGGVGIVAYNDNAQSGPGHDTYHHAGVVLGVGHDFHVGRTLSITPSLRGVSGGKGDLIDQDGVAQSNSFTLGYLIAGVALTWH